MSTAIAERPTLAVAGPSVTAEQLELVKRTVANGASDAELKLYLYDCQRQGVHPLDRLLHFTKRGGKYTPVTSIDLMRIRAAETGEYAGSDDATFVEDEQFHETSGTVKPWLRSATVTVYRLVQGTRCAFTATARGSEYYPGDQAGTMWRKMPHTMLAKCAEALALRKGFPRQLAGLYASEELDQADSKAPGAAIPSASQPVAPVAAALYPSVPNGGDSGASHPVWPAEGHIVEAEVAPDDGKLRIKRVQAVPTKNKNVTRYDITLSTGEVVQTIKSPLAIIAEQACQDGRPVSLETKATKFGTDVTEIHAADASA